MSDGFRAGSALVQFLVPRLRESFYLVDVGCSGGIHLGFRAFGDRLAGVGFDPNIVECERLASIEQHAMKYEHGFVSAPKRERYIENSPWGRLSCYKSEKIRSELNAKLSNLELTQHNLWHKTKLSDRTIVLKDYLNGIDFDYFKIDIDGPDYDVMRSIPYDTVLGISMEVNFIGGVGEHEHTFHNTDRFMRSQGFELYFLSHRTYSLAALPAKYVSGHPAQTVAGRPVQGDALYYRDAVGASLPLRRDKALKLACLFSLTEQHDSAAEVLVHYRDILDGVDVDQALDIVAHEAVGRSYAEHMKAFEADDPSFYTT